MPSIKDLRKRIASVKNTQQTTKAMKMVSAAKLRRAQEAIVGQRPYAQTIRTMFLKTASGIENLDRFPLVLRVLPENTKPRLLLVLVTSDRGLCGGFNANAIKFAARWLAANENDYQRVQLAFVGKKGFDFYKTRRIDNGPHFSEITGKVSFIQAKKLSQHLLEQFSSGEADEVKIIYNEFKNAISQTVILEDYLPLRNVNRAMDAAATSNANTPIQTPEDGVPALVKPSLDGLFKALLERHFAIQAFRILLESQAGEHGARMSSMESATKNAGEMIKKLALIYNKQRQAGITKELLEIISGSEAQKG